MRRTLALLGLVAVLAGCADRETAKLADVNARQALEENGKLRSRIDDLEARVDELEAKSETTRAH